MLFPVSPVQNCEFFTNTQDDFGLQLLDSNKNPAQILSMILINQHSNYRCLQGVTYFFEDSRITVKDGCRGDFKICFLDFPTPKPRTTERPLATTTRKDTGMCVRLGSINAIVLSHIFKFNEFYFVFIVDFRKFKIVLSELFNAL